jgi:hypothetical protein
MKAELVAFGSIEIDGRRDDPDVVIDQARLRKRVKKPLETEPGSIRPHLAVGRRGDFLGRQRLIARTWEPTVPSCRSPANAGRQTSATALSR